MDEKRYDEFLFWFYFVFTEFTRLLNCRHLALYDTLRTKVRKQTPNTICSLKVNNKYGMNKLLQQTNKKINFKFREKQTTYLGHV